VLNLCERPRPCLRRSVDKQLRDPQLLMLGNPHNPADELAIQVEVVTARGEPVEGIRHNASA
jgi:hypothetical protein